MNQAVVGLGSNQNPAHHISEAFKLLAQTFKVLSQSQIRETQAIGNSGANYLNAAVKIETSDSQTDLKKRLKQIEVSLGRDGSKPQSVVPIDLDILVWNGIVVHPDFAQRDFVKQAVLELLPNLLQN